MATFVPGQKLVPGKKDVYGKDECWYHNGKYMGKLLSKGVTGRAYDPDPEYTFECGDTVSGLGLTFASGYCQPCPNSTKGGKRKTKKRIGRKRKNRSKRNLTYKK
jgi:hypothetical protein